MILHLKHLITSLFKYFLIYRSIFFLLNKTDPHDMLPLASLCFVTALLTFCSYFLLFNFMFASE